MREIKFRAWETNKRLDSSKMSKPFTLFDLHNTGLGTFGDTYEIMQYTGLKDKNGKEIYEGDIIEFKSYWVNKKWWSTTEEIKEIEKDCEEQRKNFHLVKNTVMFKDGGFVLEYPITFKDIARGERFKKGQSNHCDTEEKQWDFEVIGNIHQNPKLI